jgi:hypothetical protein
MPFVPDQTSSRFTPDAPDLPQISDADFAEFQKQGFGGTREELQRQMAKEPAQHSIVSDLGKATVGAGETALHAATGIPAALGGGLTFAGTLAATGGDVDAAKAVQEATQNALTYQPRTKSGQAGAETLNAAMSLPGKAGEALADPTQAALTKAGVSPEVAGVLAAAVRTAPDAVLQLLGLKGMTKVGEGIADARAAADAAAAAKQAAPVATPTEVATAAGYKLRPSDVSKAEPGTNVSIGRKIEKFSSSNDLRKEFLEPNQVNTTSIAAQDIGLPKETTRITPEMMDIVIKPNAAVYKEVGDAAGKFTPFADLSAELDAVSNRRGLEPDIRAKVIQQVDKYRADTMDGPDTVKTISALRQRARNQIQNDDVGIQDRGVANRAIADALENELSRQVGALNPDLIQRFQDARTQLAKINNVDTATRAGQVDAHVLKKLQNSGVPLTGGLKIIADTAENFPWITKHPMNYADIEGDKNLAPETFYSALKSAPAALGRKFLGSETYQRSLGKTPVELGPDSPLGAYFQKREIAPTSAAPQTEIPQTPASSMLAANQLAGKLSVAEPGAVPHEISSAPTLEQLLDEAMQAERLKTPEQKILPFENNASGESSASQEAVNRVSQEKAAGRTRMLIDRDGTVTPLTGVDAVDAVARPGQLIVQKGVGENEWTILDRGGLSKTIANGKLNAAKSILSTKKKSAA